ncbi:MAG: hypothetical protein EOO01_19285 [Chitinophagaceae bacterium]|nr:MAG: hypothetical protein EOO01_19285 [Chitinophagaceae bacterium]
MEKTITLRRDQEHLLGNVVVLGKKFLGQCNMVSNRDCIMIHWKFKSPEYLRLFLKKIPPAISLN